MRTILHKGRADAVVGTLSLPGEVSCPACGAPIGSPCVRYSRRGFAAMPRKQVSELASRGGKAAHAQGVAHQFTKEEARAAGRKGGRDRARDRKAVS